MATDDQAFGRESSQPDLFVRRQALGFVQQEDLQVAGVGCKLRLFGRQVFVGTAEPLRDAACVQATQQRALPQAAITKHLQPGCHAVLPGGQFGRQHRHRGPLIVAERPKRVAV